MSGAARDPYIDQDSGVLRNNLGYKDAADLATAEYELAEMRTNELISRPLPKKITFKTLQSIHKHLFQDVYDWAGKIRTVDISKGQTIFAHCARIEPEAEKLIEQIHKENDLVGLSPQKFCERLSHYFNEMNVIHPFREGNGRATRLFFSQIAARAGYKLNFSNISQEEWVRACEHGYKHDSSMLQDLFERNTSPLATLPSPPGIEKLPNKMRECRIAREIRISVPIRPRRHE